MHPRSPLALLAPVAMVPVLAMAGGPSVAVSPATAGAPVFDGGRILPGQGGGEPSIAVDTTTSRDRNHVYVEAIGGWGSSPPHGQPAGSGPKEWHSYDDGKKWATFVPFDPNGELRGEDGDIVVDPFSNVIVTDLDVSHAWVQVSKDDGRTFNTGTPTAPEDDRPWLTAFGHTVYVAYHDFAAEVPVVCTSTNDGQTFTTCDPFTLTAGQEVSNCAENTIPGRALAVDPSRGKYHGALNFLYSCSTAGENVQHPPYGPLHDYYLAQSTNGGLSYSDYPVFVASTSGGKAPNYANIFGTLAIDSAGNYYALIDGTANDNDPARNPYHVYLITSTDHGHTWSKPKLVDHDPNGRGTHVFAHLVVTRPGNVDIVWDGTTATGEPNGVCGTETSQHPCKDGFPLYSSSKAPAWNVYLAQTTDALAAHPRFVQRRVSRSPIHYGEICTNGIVCGSSDRTLLDFISVAVDCHGWAHIVFATNTKAQEAADFSNGAANVEEVNQTGGRALAPPPSCS
jgi:hypothetical protein